MKKMETGKMVQLSLLTALIILMSIVPFLGYIPLGITNATIIHIPVIIGSIVLGPIAGAFLGFVFGLTSFLHATYAPTIASFIFTPFYSVGNISGNFWSLVIAFVPRILVGVVPYFVYHLIAKRQQKIALISAGVAGSLTNTLLVMNFVYLFFGESYASVTNKGLDTLYSAIIAVICVNGIPEALLAGALTVGICTALFKAGVTQYTAHRVLSKTE